MKIPKTTILPAVSELAKVATGRGFPIMGCIRARATAGALFLSACDLDQSLSLELPCEGDLPEMAISASRLNGLVSAAADEINLTAGSGRLAITSGFKAEIGVADAKDFPEIKMEKSKKIGVNCTDLADAIEAVEWCAASGKNHRENLKSVHVRLSDTMMLCEASSGVSMARVSKSAICAKAEFVIPVAIASRLVWALRQDGAVVSTSENAIAVTFSGGAYVCKLMEMQYPNYDSAMKGYEFTKLGTISAKALKEAIGGCLFLCPPQETPNLAIELSVDSLWFGTKFTGDMMERTLPGEFTSRKLNMNGESLSECLSAFDGEATLLTTKEFDSPLLIQAGDLSVYTMQVRGK